MQEILSQNEIDSLLNALTSGELSVEQMQEHLDTIVKAYDFRRPSKFSKQQISSLEIMHQHFARLLSTFLSGYLRTAVNVDISSVGEMIFEEFMRSVPNPTVLYIFEMKPLEGLAILEANLQTIYPMVDILFGGAGSGFVDEREMTDIEMMVIRRLGIRILENLILAWKDFVPVEINVHAVETNPTMQQLYSPNEVVALITLSLSFSEGLSGGILNLCLPYILLESVIDKISVRQRFVREAGPPKVEDLEMIQHWLGLAQVGVDVILGETELTMKDLLHLKEGDIIMLNRRYDQDVDMCVEGECKFGVQIGRFGSNKAVQVVSLVERGCDNA